MPDLGLGERPVLVGIWLIELGQEAVEGDCMLEVVSDDVVIDLTAPVSGTLAEKCVGADDCLVPGMKLGAFLASREPSRDCEE